MSTALILLLVLTACASPSERLAARAVVLGMRADVIAGSGFQHVVFRHTGRSSRTLHVYIDGDGTPWFAGRPAADPTPRKLLVLALMALDPDPSIYLGRPCYNGLAETPPCSGAMWTRERYSEAVVSSMAAAMQQVLRDGGFERVIWFGYSGGGTLAVLLAPRFAETVGVVTVAANLDIDAWADLHGYPRLAASLNPAAQTPLPERILQRHYAGGQDRVVPRDIVARGPIDARTLILIPSYDHTCCWRTIWPAVLKGVDSATD